MMTAKEVVAHLKEFGLVGKILELLDGGAALGLKLQQSVSGRLYFHRGNEIPKLKERLSRQELFLMCRKLTGHYPIARWFQMACNYIKRNAEEKKWDGEEVKKTTVMKEVLEEVEKDDPVRGRWEIPKTKKGVVWCDASSIATGVVLRVGGVVAEDAVWLRKKDDAGHVNITELDGGPQRDKFGPEVEVVRDMYKN